MTENESRSNEGPTLEIDPELLAMLAAVKRQPSGLAPMQPSYGAMPSSGAQRDLRFTVWAVGGLMAAIIGGTVWFTSVNSVVAKAAALQIKVDAQDKMLEAHERAIALNTKELFSEDRKAMIKQHIEMWNMLERGESNQDAFFAKKGFYSPSDTRAHLKPQ